MQICATDVLVRTIDTEENVALPLWDWYYTLKQESLRHLKIQGTAVQSGRNVVGVPGQAGPVFWRACGNNGAHADPPWAGVIGSPVRIYCRLLSRVRPAFAHAWSLSPPRNKSEFPRRRYALWNAVLACAIPISDIRLPFSHFCKSHKIQIHIFSTTVK